MNEKFTKVVICPVWQENPYGGSCEVFAIAVFNFELQKQ